MINKNTLRRIAAVRNFLKIHSDVVAGKLGIPPLEYLKFEAGALTIGDLTIEDIAAAMGTTTQFIEAFIMSFSSDESGQEKEKPFGPHSFFSGPERELEITIRIKIK